MSKSLSRLTFGVMIGGLLLAGRPVFAQGPAGTSGMGVGSSPLINPYMSPYANPYLNPTLTTGTMNRSDTLLYMWSAQQQPGGLLSASGPGAGRAAKGSSGSKAAEMPRSVMMPGGGASKYFNQGATGASTSAAIGTRYGRQGRFFSHNGR